MSKSKPNQPGLPRLDSSLPPDLERIFAPLCADLDAGQVQDLATQVRAYPGEIRQALAYNEFLDIESAEKIAAVLGELLSDYPALSPEGRQLVTGAGRYFIRGQDAHADLGSLLGFDDDVSVLNYVLTQIGWPERSVKL